METNINPSPQGDPDSSLLIHEEDFEGQVLAGTDLVAWSDLFYGILVAPRQTLSYLAGPLFKADGRSVLFAIALVSLVAIASSCEGGTSNVPVMILKVVSNVIATFIGWLLLSVILTGIAQYFPAANKRFLTILVTTGWAFLPYLFLSPITCFKALPGFAYAILSSLPSIWFCYLEWLAFQCILKLDNKRMIMLALVAPPVVAFIYIFWAGTALALLSLQVMLNLVDLIYPAIRL